jgi:hypothetical protein
MAKKAKKPSAASAAKKTAKQVVNRKRVTKTQYLLQKGLSRY